MLAHPLLNTENGTEIASIDEFMKEISELNKKCETPNIQLFYRGQEADFWKIEPSIFRNDLLSIEHILMFEPLRQIPKEFSGLNNSFEIMEKYQHYGMCTRLLDITTNPLAALYFACLPHNEEEYFDEEGKIQKQKPYGVVYIKKEEGNSVLYNSLQTNIISTLARYDMRDGMKIEIVLKRLQEDGVISTEQKTRWCTSDGFDKFVEIVQKVYTVLPILSNERLVKQSGAFLLPGKFNFSITKGDEKNGYMYKSTCNLLSEFEKEFFYIEPEKKDGILKELEACNINDSSLFPELEHQLKYIRKVNESKKQKVPYYEEFQKSSRVDAEEIVTDVKLHYEVVENAVKEILNDEKLVYKISTIIVENASIDWIKRNSVLSRMKMEICKTLMEEGEEKRRAYNMAVEIMKVIIKKYENVGGGVS